MFPYRILVFLLLVYLSSSYRPYPYHQCSSEELYIYTGLISITSDYQGYRRQCYNVFIDGYAAKDRNVNAIASPR